MYEYVGARKNDVLKNSNEFYVDDVCYKIASTPSVILQYYELLENIGQDYISKDFIVTAQEQLINNLYGKIIVAINSDGILLGGARLILSTPENRCLLPLESSSFKLESLFPHMNLKNKIYAEWGRFIVHPGVPNKKRISENIARMCIIQSYKLNAAYLFGMPILCMKNRYEQIFSNMRLNFTPLLSCSEIPRYTIAPNVDFYLAVTDLNFSEQLEDIVENYIS
jgi:hypothetical protein